ncbi:MAG: hypothetical protein WCS37_17570 [Chloroflexota bacterium]|nr:SPW repeat protein [Chloroflexota bacterium]
MKNTAKLFSFSTVNLTLTGVLGALGGVWLILAPSLLNYTLPTKTQGDNATLMAIICGVIAIVLSLFCTVTEKQVALQKYRFIAGSLLVVLGIWLMAAPYLFNYAIVRDALWSLQITGGLFALTAGFVMEELYTRSKEEA